MWGVSPLVLYKVKVGSWKTELNTYFALDCSEVWIQTNAPGLETHHHGEMRILMPLSHAENTPWMIILRMGLTLIKHNII